MRLCKIDIDCPFNQQFCYRFSVIELIADNIVKLDRAVVFYLIAIPSTKKLYQ